MGRRITKRAEEIAMLLKEYLDKTYTRDVLIFYAKVFEVKGYSKLRKQELITKILDNFCTEEMFRKRLACLTNEQVELLLLLQKSSIKIINNQIVDAMILKEFWLCYFEEETDQLCIFEEVNSVFSRIYDDEFRADQRRKGWMTKCLGFFHKYYGIAPLEVIYECYKQRSSDSIEEMIDLLKKMPIDITEVAIYSMEELGMKNWPKTNPLYSEKGILFGLEYDNDETLDNLLKNQLEKDFYIPTAEIIDEIQEDGYEKNTEKYKNIERFLMQRLNMSLNDAQFWCYEINMIIYTGNSVTKVLNKMSEEKIVFQDEETIQELINLLTDVHNHTRMKENRGFQPAEIREHTLDELQHVPGTIVKAEKKIYPNDPCPCGSGKKYKKCCGRK